MYKKFIKNYNDLNEGAWASGPLDNDGASDWKWKFGDMILKELNAKLNGSDYHYKYYAIGLWEFFKIQLKTQYSFFKEDDIKMINTLTLKASKDLLENRDKLINNYSEPDKIISYLKKYIKDNEN